MVGEAEEDARSFWARVDRSEDGCWPWRGCCDPHGYGRLRWKGGSALAHRVALSLSGTVVARGQMVLHSCDNPTCCNPLHLRTGTHDDNMSDMKARNRRAYGDRLSKRLSSEIAAEILQSENSDEELAKRYGVSKSMIALVRRGGRWAHIPADGATALVATRRKWRGKGEGHSQAKLTAEQVLAIRADDRLQKDIAKAHGISQAAVSDIKCRRRWGYL